MKTNYLTTAAKIASVVAPLAVSTGVNAQSIDDILAPSKTTSSTIEISTGCGDEKKANCQEVLPAINEKLPAGTILVAKNSGGSVESLARICKGEFRGGIVQADAVLAVQQKYAACKDKFEAIGAPVYPYVGYMVVRADSPANSFADLLENARKAKRPLTMATGSATSGGTVTMNAILDTSDEVKNTVNLDKSSGKQALDRLDDGKIEAYFFMDAEKSEQAEMIRKLANKENGALLYKLVSVDMPETFYRNTAKLNDYPIYSERSVSYTYDSWHGRTTYNAKTISVNAVFAVASDFYNSDEGKRAVSNVREAIDSSRATVRSATGTSTSWVPVRKLK